MTSTLARSSFNKLAVYVVQESKQANDLLLVMYELVCHGADPTLRCGSNHQPKQLAHKTGFDLGVIFLGERAA